MSIGPPHSNPEFESSIRSCLLYGIAKHFRLIMNSSFAPRQPLMTERGLKAEQPKQLFSDKQTQVF